mgnify:CR=1 FL=1|tara:strand:- start:1256 stop:1669 length:414 start_codon:yes stop_codon:yes gene_type:complete
MGAKTNEKQITVFIDQDERKQFQALCKTMQLSVSSVVRTWIQTAIEEQSVNVSISDQGASLTPKKQSVEGLDSEVFKSILKRIDHLESEMPKFDIDDLMRMKKEVLDGEFGSLRHRMGIIEAMVQSQGGSIVWNEKE